jgi:hypothetical protein
MRNVFTKLLNGLREVHSHKLLHLDLKPSNIYMRNDIHAGADRLRRRRQTLPATRRCSSRCTRRASPRPSTTTSASCSARGATSTASAHRCMPASPGNTPQAADERMEKDRLIPAMVRWEGSTRISCSKRSTGACASTTATVRKASSRCRKRSPKRSSRPNRVQCKKDWLLTRSSGKLRKKERPMKFTIYQESRTGKRANNEDRLAYCYSRDALLMVVADGMGGHYYGEVAAQIAVQTLAEAFPARGRPRNPRPLHVPPEGHAERPSRDS